MEIPSGHGQLSLAMLHVLWCAPPRLRGLPTTAVSGTMREASSAGFRAIANFIFGARHGTLATAAAAYRARTRPNTATPSRRCLLFSLTLVVRVLALCMDTVDCWYAASLRVVLTTSLCRMACRQQHAGRCSSSGRQGRGHRHDQPSTHGDSGQQEEGRGDRYDVSQHTAVA